MSPLDIGGILVAVIAAFGAWAAQRSAARANTASTKVEAEREAYERARKMDVETIERQDTEMRELREENIELRKEVRLVREENVGLRQDNANLREHVRNVENRLAKLEDISPALEQLLRQRLEEAGHDDHKQ